MKLFPCCHTCPKCHRDHEHLISNPTIQIDNYWMYCNDCAQVEASKIKANGGKVNSWEAPVITPLTGRETWAPGWSPNGRAASAPNAPDRQTGRSEDLEESASHEEAMQAWRLADRFALSVSDTEGVGHLGVSRALSLAIAAQEDYEESVSD